MKLKLRVRRGKYRLSRLDEPVLMTGLKPFLAQLGIHHRLESCAMLYKARPLYNNFSGLVTPNIASKQPCLPKKRLQKIKATTISLLQKAVSVSNLFLIQPNPQHHFKMDGHRANVVSE